MNTTPIFVGIDVSKAHLDSATRPGGQAGRDRQRPGRHRRPGRPAQAPGPEPWSSSRPPAGWSCPCSRPCRSPASRSPRSTPARPATSPRRPGRLAKTDRIDAEVLAHFAEADPPRRPAAALGRGAGPGRPAVPPPAAAGDAGHGVQPPGQPAPTRRCGPGWSGTWPGWRPRSPTPIGSWPRRSRRARPGGRRTSCCGASPGWGRSPA